jgi:hypothetical protein
MSRIHRDYTVKEGSNMGKTVMKCKIIRSREAKNFEYLMDDFLKDKDTYSVQFKPENASRLVAMILYPVELDLMQVLTEVEDNE